MSRHLLVLSVFVVSCALPACAESDTSEPTTTGPTEEACGIIDCNVADDNVNTDNITIDVSAGGKADAPDRVAAALVEVTADGELDAVDVERLFEEAGGKISVDEIAIIRDALGDNPNYTITAEAVQQAHSMARVANVTSDAEAAEILSNVSFGGTEIPEAVQQAVANARLNGAVAYDVKEVDDDGELVWTHYPSISPAIGNMAFDYTEITPQKLIDDLNDTDVMYNAIIGQEIGVTSWGKEYKRAKYEERKGGSGTIVAHYDEVFHHDLFARGSQSQKWASNLAILSDGTIHCLPAARRDVNQRVILTNPALARERHLLYNGHIQVVSGQVVSVELSGRLSKFAAKGKAVFIDPVPLLEAWGFDVSPDLRLRYGNTEDGVPVQENGVIKQAETTSP